MDQSPLVHVFSLYKLRSTASTECSSETCGALLGRFRVAEHTEKYPTTPPFHIPAGGLVFRDLYGQNHALLNDASNGLTAKGVDEIRCEVLCSQPSWFSADIMVLLTHWRYIPPPSTLRGQESAAWAYIEVLSSPILIPSTLHPPRTKRPLSWWIENQIYPDADVEKHFIETFRALPQDTIDSVAQLLERQRDKQGELQVRGRDSDVEISDSSLEFDIYPEGQKRRRRRKKHKGNSDGNNNVVSIMGRIAAISSLIGPASSNEADNVVKFLVDIEINTAAMCGITSNTTVYRDTERVQLTRAPVLVTGSRFLGLFASLCVDDSVFATRLNAVTIYTDNLKAEPVFTTSETSEILKVDGFECLNHSHTNHLRSSQASFSQASQEALLASISTDGFRSDSRSNVDHNSLAGKSQTAAGQETHALGSNNAQSQHQCQSSNDMHLLVNKGRLESYSGEITNVVDFMLGIYVIDNAHLLMLTYWPLLTPLTPLRRGTRVTLDNVHVILLSNSRCYNWTLFEKASGLQQQATSATKEENRVLVFGACARTLVRITEFPTNSSPCELPCILDRSLVAAVVGGSLGLVHMIESVEAFWNLQSKFSAGLRDRGKKSDEANELCLNSLQLVKIALKLTKVHTDFRMDQNVPTRNLCAEFLNHQKSCCVDATTSPEPMRAVSLRSIIQRFVDWQTRHKTINGLDSKSGGENTSASENQIRSGGGNEAQVVKVYPPSLQLEGIPILGRVIINDRGSVYLQDDTGTIKILPHFGFGRSKEMTENYPTFPSQRHIGHIYVWSSWCFLSEQIDVGSIIGKDERRRPASMMLAPADSVFSLVYASVSDPHVLYEDHTFGGVSGYSNTSQFEREKGSGSFLSRLDSEAMAQCFVFIVRSAKSQLYPSKTKAHGFQVKVAVSGVALKAGLYQFHPQFAPQEQPVGSSEKVLDIGCVDEKDLDECILILSLDEIPALLEPDTAYIVCIHDSALTGKIDERKVMNGGRLASGTGSALCIKIGKYDHLHPVNITMSSPSRDAEQVVFGVPRLSDDLFDLPYITSHAASDYVFNMVTMNSTVYSVRDIHRYCSEASDSKLKTGKLVSVTGVILKRELLEAAAFEDIATSKLESVSSETSTRQTQVTGCFKTLFVLQDHVDATHTISLYINLTSFSHPLGLIPGSRVIVRNVAPTISHSTGKAYLSATAISSIQAALINMASANRRDEAVTKSSRWSASQYAEVVDVPFIGHLYSRHSLWNRKLHLSGCYIDNVSSIQIIIVCAKCGQTVCSMQCCCGSKTPKILKSLVASGPQRRKDVYADISLTAQISDGSGIALVAVSDADALCELLQLPPQDLESVYQAAAQSSDGKLVWKQRSRQDGAIQLTGAQDLLGVAATTVTKSTVLRIEGVLQSTEAVTADEAVMRPIVKQTVRLGGRDCTVNRYATATILALKMSRMTAAEWSWKLIESLAVI